jgi:hypothetical protein
VRTLSADASRRGLIALLLRQTDFLSRFRRACIDASRRGSCTGFLDVDANVHSHDATAKPVENIAWAQPPKGRYRVWVEAVEMDREGQPSKTPFTVRMTAFGNATEKTFDDIAEDDEITAFEFTL